MERGRLRRPRDGESMQLPAEDNGRRASPPKHFLQAGSKALLRCLKTCCYFSIGDDLCQRTTSNHCRTGGLRADTPVHANSQVTYLVDAHSTFITMCRHFLMARKYIYIAAWGITPLMELVRGTDQRAGPDGSS